MCAYSTARRRLTPSEGSGACDFRPRAAYIFAVQNFFAKKFLRFRSVELKSPQKHTPRGCKKHWWWEIMKKIW